MAKIKENKMVTFLKYPRRWDDGTYELGLTGLSTDTKPTNVYKDLEIANGSSFFEFDTIKIYFYDKSSNTWIAPARQVTGYAGGGGGSSSGTSSGTGGTVTIPKITATASITNSTGTPTVTVTRSGTDAAPQFKFAFSGLKGAKGDKGDAGSSSSSGTSTVSGDITGTSLSITPGEANTVAKGSGAIGNNNNVGGSSSLAVGYNNTTKGIECFAAGGYNNVNLTPGFALGEGLNVNATYQTAIGLHFSGIRNTFPLVVARNSENNKKRFNFAVYGESTQTESINGIILRGTKNGADAYYLLRVINGELKITDYTSSIKWS